MQSNDVYMVAGATALVAAAYIGVGLPLALVVLAACLIYFAHVLPSVHLGRSQPEPDPVSELPQPVYDNTRIGGVVPKTMLHCALCRKDYERGTEHVCEKRKT